MNLRRQRLAEEIRDVLGSCFQGDILQDPRLSKVTITAVKLSPDLLNASVYYRVYLEGEDEQTRAGLEHAAGFFRRRIAESLRLRRVPELRFYYDFSVERGARIEYLLDQIRVRG